MKTQDKDEWIRDQLDKHKVGMARAFGRCRDEGVRDTMFRTYALWIMDKVWRIDPNPRLATLTLFLHYNCHELEQYSEVIWNYYFFNK